MYLILVPQRDLYDVLGISEDQDLKGIKAVYRQLARTFHPDVHSSADAAEHFREIIEAFVVLADPEKRKAYDRQRRRRYRGTEKETETYLGLRLAGIDLGRPLRGSVTV